jgi:DNA-binding PadR family transcriptional regulator
MRRTRARGGSASQTAARILILIDVLGLPVELPCPVPDAVRVVRSLTRLEKLDFWLRNPDYLADELMTEYEEGRLAEAAVRVPVQRMLSELAAGHHYPMIRFHFGAYEVVDNALAKLKATGLIAHRRGADSGDRARHDYYLLTKGVDKAAQMRESLAELKWYEQQADAIAFLAESMQGSAARKRQYDQPEYKGARIGTEIPPVFERARARAVDLGLMEGGQ